MLHQPIANKKGGSTAAIDYLLNERVEEGTAKVIDGNEKITRDIINSIQHKQKVCVGVLSFEEDDLPTDTKQQIMSDFEKTLLPGLTKGEDYNILWVEHTDKGRLELNYVIPKIHLPTQKALNPYYDRADRSRIEIFRDIQNDTYQLSSPLDPSKKQTLNNDKKINQFNDKKQLNEQLYKLVSEGVLENREQLISALKESNIQVTREGKDYISIKLPEDKKATKLKGGIYNEQFTSITAVREQIESAQTDVRRFNQRDTLEAIRNNRDKLKEYTERKREFIAKQYLKDENKLDNSISNTNNINHNNTVNISNNKELDKTRDIDTKRQKILSLRKQADNLQERHQEDNTTGRLDIHTTQHHQTEREQINNERDIIYSDSIERLRRERKNKYNAYRKARETRTDVHTTIKDAAERVRERTGEMGRKIESITIQSDEHFRTVSKNQSTFARLRDRAREYYETTKQAIKEFANSVKEKLTPLEKAKNAQNEMQRYLDAHDLKNTPGNRELIHDAKDIAQRSVDKDAINYQQKLEEETNRVLKDTLEYVQTARQEQTQSKGMSMSM
jgi:hypothetical protein